MISPTRDRTTDIHQIKETAEWVLPFWLVDCLAHRRRLDDAHGIFRRAAAAGNELGLFAEEFDLEHGEMMGNFPQALTHLSLIMACMALAEGNS